MDCPESVDPGDKPAEEPVRKRHKTDTGTNSGLCVATERFDRCWEEIITYIPRLDDMFALIESCAYLQSMVDSFVRKANPYLTIDRCCLNLYPLDGYEHLYQRIGPLVTTLTVYKVTEQDFIRLSLIFKNIRHLHLKRILLIDPISRPTFPRLLNVKLTECAIHRDTLHQMVFGMSSTTRHFHLNKSTVHCRFTNLPWNNGKVVPKHLMARPRRPDYSWIYPDFTRYGQLLYRMTDSQNFSEVTLEWISCKGGFLTLCDGTESLRIVDCDESVTLTNIRVKGKYLKCLSLETIASIRDFAENIPKLGVDSSLEMLTLSHLFTPLDWLRGLENLKQLRILLPIQKYQEMALNEALSAMDNEIEVKYSVSPDPEVNQILNVLNEDCLREILSFVTLDDIFNLAETHSRFKVLISSIDVSSIGISVRIDKEFLSRHPINQKLTGYETLGHSLSKLLLECSGEEFSALAPCFPRVRNLQLEETNWKWNDQLVEVFPMVEALEFFDEINYISKDTLVKLLLKLRPTLRVFNGFYICANYKYYDHLHNVREVYIDGTKFVLRK